MALAEEKYISVETFRKDGTGVSTPLWFVEMNGEIFFYTLEESGKVKRLRRNARVRVAPCDMRGRVHGDWKEGTARFADKEESARAYTLLNQKYGWQRALLNFFSHFSKKTRTVVAIRVA